MDSGCLSWGIGATISLRSFRLSFIKRRRLSRLGIFVPVAGTHIASNNFLGLWKSVTEKAKGTVTGATHTVQNNGSCPFMCLNKLSEKRPPEAAVCPLEKTLTVTHSPSRAISIFSALSHGI
jgi:hypothetical protein